MANTRWELMESTWNRVKKAYPEVFIPEKELATPPPKVHCDIPMCIGYSPEATVPFEILDAWIRAINSKGFTYTIYTDPRQEIEGLDLEVDQSESKLTPLEKWYKELKNWQLANPDNVLKDIPLENIKPIQALRETQQWQKAKSSVIALKDDKKEAFEIAMQKDILPFCKKYEKKHKKKISDEELDKLLEKLKLLSAEHTIQTASDYLSWMRKCEFLVLRSTPTLSDLPGEHNAYVLVQEEGQMALYFIDRSDKTPTLTPLNFLANQNISMLLSAMFPLIENNQYKNGSVLSAQQLEAITRATGHRQTVHLLWYAHSLSKTMNEVKRVAHHEGYDAQALIHLMPECQKISNKLQETIVSKEVQGSQPDTMTTPSNDIVQVDNHLVMRDIVRAFLYTTEDLQKKEDLKKAGELLYYTAFASHMASNGKTSPQQSNSPPEIPHTKLIQGSYGLIKDTMARNVPRNENTIKVDKPPLDEIKKDAAKEFNFLNNKNLVTQGLFKNMEGTNTRGEAEVKIFPNYSLKK